MKVIAINGSPRPDGNTAMLLGKVLEPIAAEGIETEVFQLGCNLIAGCKACYACFRDKNRTCAQADDVVNACILKMAQADGIILGSPTYFADITPELKALIDRGGLVAMANGAMFRRKVGAAVIAVRRGGSIHAFDSINHFFLIGQMIVPGSCYWNFGIGRNKGDVADDEEGMRTMQVLGENVAWVIKKTLA